MMGIYKITNARKRKSTKRKLLYGKIYTTNYELINRDMKYIRIDHRLRLTLRNKKTIWRLKTELYMVLQKFGIEAKTEP